MLDLTLADDKLWLQLQRQKKRLQQFAQLDITADPAQKDDYARRLRAWAFNLTWDSLNGGHYRVSPQRVSFSSFHNLILAEYFLAAGRTFFDGELIYLSNNILSVIAQKLCSNKTTGITSAITYPTESAPFVFTGVQIKTTLDPAEQQLLKALIGHAEFAVARHYAVSYCRTLKSAAAMAKLEFKQAQLLEASIRRKLIRLGVEDSVAKAVPVYQKTENQTSITVTLSAQCLSLLVQQQLYKPHAEAGTLAINLKHCLLAWLRQFSAQDELDLTIDCAYSLLDSCQIDYDIEVIRLVSAMLHVDSNNLPVSMRAKILLARTLKILRLLGEKMPHENPEQPGNGQVIPIDPLTIAVEWLPQSQTEASLQQQRNAACFNAELKVFPSINA